MTNRIDAISEKTREVLDAYNRMNAHLDDDSGLGEATDNTVYNKTIDRNIDGSSLQGLIKLPGRNLGISQNSISDDDLLRLRKVYSDKLGFFPSNSDLESFKDYYAKAKNDEKQKIDESLFAELVEVGLIQKMPLL